MTQPDWTIGRGDIIDGKLSSSAEDTFTAISIAYTDRVTGERGYVSALRTDATKHLGLFERHVDAKRPMDHAEAQSLADRAIAIGYLQRHGYVTVRLAQRLTHRSGIRPAAEIEKGNTVQLDWAGGVHHVVGVTHDECSGTAVVMLGDDNEDERFEVALTLMRLELGPGA